MTDPSQAHPIRIEPIGAVSGVAWAMMLPGGGARGGGITIIGKLVFAVEEGGGLKVCTPEPPGRHLGEPAPEEVSQHDARKLLVRGGRAFPGSAMLRRGSITIANVEFPPGNDTASVDVESSGKTVSSGQEGDWFVLSGATDAGARKWARLPEIGVVATWGTGDRMILTYKVCAVCVVSSTLSLVFRGSKLVDEVPAGIRLKAATMDELAGSLAASITVRQAQTAEIDPRRVSSIKTELPFHAMPLDRPVAAAPLIPYAPTGTNELATPAAPGAPFSEPGELVETQFAPLPVALGPSLPFAGVVDPPRTGTPMPSPAFFPTPAPMAAPVPVGVPLPVPVTAPPAVPGVMPSAMPAATPVRASGARRAEVPANPRAELERRLSASETLDGLSFRGASLAGMTLCDANLSGLDFSGADLSGTDLSGADLTGSDLSRVKMVDARLDRAKLERAKLIGASLTRVSFQGASLYQARAMDCVTKDVDFEQADLRDADFSRAKLAGVRMVSASADGLNAKGADLTGADLSRAKLGRSSFQGASLRRAVLVRTRLANADLRDADLRDVEPESSLQGADLEGARRS